MATKSDRESGILYASSGDTTFIFFIVLRDIGGAACCPIWVSVGTLKAEELSEHWSLSDAGELFLPYSLNAAIT